MTAKTYLKFHHKIDIYEKTVTTNSAGQRTVSFSKSATIPAVFQAMDAEKRIEPYISNIDEYSFYISHQDKDLINYNNRIQNVVDRYGNIIESGPLEIVNIRKYTSYTGRLSYILVGARKVVENA